jgi:hypothetical protein
VIKTVLPAIHYWRGAQNNKTVLPVVHFRGGPKTTKLSYRLYSTGGEQNNKTLQPAIQYWGAQNNQTLQPAIQYGGAQNNQTVLPPVHPNCITCHACVPQSSADTRGESWSHTGTQASLDFHCVPCAPGCASWSSGQCRTRPWPATTPAAWLRPSNPSEQERNMRHEIRKEKMRWGTVSM